MGSTSLWQTQLQSEPGAMAQMEPLRGAREADVVIVGAGITGASAALWLAREGVRVVVLEERHVAAGASGRNAGFLLSGTSESYGTAVSHYGREQARRIWDFNKQNHILARQIVEELRDAGWRCDYARSGSLRIAASEEEFEEIRAGMGLLAEDGWHAELVERAALPARLHQTYFGGAFYPDDAEIQPARFVTGIVRLAQRSGAVFYGGSPVVALTAADDAVVVATSAGEVHARSVILATNAWLPTLATLIDAPWLARAIVPTRGQVLATSPVSEPIFPCPCYADDGYQYWRQLPDGRLVIGGWRNRSFATEASSDETPGAQVQDHLDAFVHTTLGLPEARIEQRWAGIMAFSEDGLPLIGRMPGSSRIFLSGGYTGHGNAYALYATQMLSQLVMDHDHPAADLFDPARFVSAGRPTREA